MFLSALPAAAHIKNLGGKLIDLVRKSDIIVVGVVTTPASMSRSGDELSIEVLDVLHGTLEEKTLTARTAARLIAGERQVIFLKRADSKFECVQPSGTRFPATPDDDDLYRRTVTAIAAALRLPEADQVKALRAALIPALRAQAMPLRYHAALELSAMNHEGHRITPEDRLAIEEVRRSPDFDPTLAPIVDALLRDAKR